MRASVLAGRLSGPPGQHLHCRQFRLRHPGTGDDDLGLAKNPNPGKVDDSLNSVVCISADNCWAAGEQDSGASATNEQSLIEHWDGTRW